MNKDNFEGTVRSAVGQGEKILGQVTGDRSTSAQGYYDDAAGKARSAVGSAKDAVSDGVDAISVPRFLRACAIRSASSLSRFPI